MAKITIEYENEREFYALLSAIMPDKCEKEEVRTIEGKKLATMYVNYKPGKNKNIEYS